MAVQQPVTLTPTYHVSYSRHLFLGLVLLLAMVGRHAGAVVSHNPRPRQNTQTTTTLPNRPDTIPASAISDAQAHGGSDPPHTGSTTPQEAVSSLSSSSTNPVAALTRSPGSGDDPMGRQLPDNFLSANTISEAVDDEIGAGPILIDTSDASIMSGDDAPHKVEEGYDVLYASSTEATATEAKPSEIIYRTDSGAAVNPPQIPESTLRTPAVPQESVDAHREGTSSPSISNPNVSPTTSFPTASSHSSASTTSAPELVSASDNAATSSLDADTNADTNHTTNNENNTNNTTISSPTNTPTSDSRSNNSTPQQLGSDQIDTNTIRSLPAAADNTDPSDPSTSPTGVPPIFTATGASGSSRAHLRSEDARGLMSPSRYSEALGQTVLRSDEERLLDYLFREYNPSARPVINSSKSVQVSIQFSLMHFQELNVKSQILTSTGLLIMEWVDERLRWDPREFNLNEIVISAKMLWVPEFAVINGAEEIYGDYREFRAIMTSDGNIRWEPGGVFKTMCEIDITYFPFDEQHCALIFGAWSYHTTKMNLTNSSSTINLDSYERNGEWEILSTKVTRDEFFYECCPKERFSNVAFRLHMRRRYTFYVMNVILPSMVTSILLLSIFYCPPGQKVQIGVVVLLSFRIFLLNVTDSIPKTSDHIPLLGIYLTCTMAITTLSMVLTVMVLNLHSISERPVPRWVRIIVLRHLARLFCIGTDEVEASKKDEKAIHVKKKRKGVGRMSATLVEDDGEERMPIIAINGAVNAGQGGGGGGGQETSFVHMRSGSYANLRMNNNTAPAFGEGTSASTRQEEEKPDFSKDWHKLAEVVDRLFFWTFLLAIVAISILLFHPLTKNYLIPRPGVS